MTDQPTTGAFDDAVDAVYDPFAPGVPMDPSFRRTVGKWRQDTYAELLDDITERALGSWMLSERARMRSDIERKFADPQFAAERIAGELATRIREANPK